MELRSAVCTAFIETNLRFEKSGYALQAVFDGGERPLHERARP
jgi:hypothetical protein